jgi:signal transduction histidine kinase
MALRHRWSADQIVARFSAELEAMRPATPAVLTLTVHGDAALMRTEVAREACQVLKEAVNNAVRHADATEINVRLTVTASGVEGVVADNGIGISPQAALNGTPGHWGIIGMRERISRLGGLLTIDGGDTGTTLRFTLD